MAGTEAACGAAAQRFASVVMLDLPMPDPEPAVTTPTALTLSEFPFHRDPLSL